MLLKKGFAVFLCALFLYGCAGYERRTESIRAAHPEWDEQTLGKLAARNVQPGMTHEMVKAALGNPDSLSREGEEEVWGYAYYRQEGENYRKVFVFFVHLNGGKVVRTRGDTTHLQTLY